MVEDRGAGRAEAGVGCGRAVVAAAVIHIADDTANGGFGAAGHLGIQRDLIDVDRGGLGEDLCEEWKEKEERSGGRHSLDTRFLSARGEIS